MVSLNHTELHSKDWEPQIPQIHQVPASPAGGPQALRFRTGTAKRGAERFT